MNRHMYFMYETAHSIVSPSRAFMDTVSMFYRNPLNPIAQTSLGRSVSAACELFERVTRRYGKPSFNLPTTVIDGNEVSITETVVFEKPFCRLVRFERGLNKKAAKQSKLLIVAPMSGHYATLLRGTVEAFLPTHDVYITDWVDARTVPLSVGSFDLDDYIDYMIEMFGLLGENTHVLAVCQPSVPVIAAIARMEADKAPVVPVSMTLMGGPIDTRESPTEVNKVAKKRGTAWFKQNCIMRVPFPNPGFMREVYPGFLQLSGFMAMNMDKHMSAHSEMFKHLVQGDGESADKHRDFYDEYMAVCDLTAEYYLQTVDTVFVQHSLPKGEMMHRDEPVDLKAIRRTALMTVEGERDDISGVGQTKATHDLCVNIPKDRQLYHLQEKVGHYGVFNGKRFKNYIVPAMNRFMIAMEAPVALPASAKAAANTNAAGLAKPAASAKLASAKKR